MNDREFTELTCDVKAVKDDDRVLRFVATTATRDRVGDELPLSGWDFASYRKNPVFLWAHDYAGLPIGSTRKISREDLGDGKKGWVFDVEFASQKANPLAERCFNCCKEGHIKSVSVGFRSLESKWIDESDEEKEQREKDAPDQKPGKVFKKKELLELSLVPVPANPEALLVARKKGLELPRELEAALDKVALDKASEALARTKEIKEKLEESTPGEEIEIAKDLEETTITKPGWDDDPKRSEIAYRVREPGAFKTESFRRITLQKNKPRVNAVVGRLKGEDTMKVQSLRFPREDDWTLSKAKAWLKEHPDVVKEFDRTCDEFDIDETFAHCMHDFANNWMPCEEVEKDIVWSIRSIDPYSIKCWIEDNREWFAGIIRETLAKGAALPVAENADTELKEDVATNLPEDSALPATENADTATEAKDPVGDVLYRLVGNTLTFRLKEE